MAAAAPLLGVGSQLLTTFGEARSLKQSTAQAISNAKISTEAAGSALKRGRADEARASLSAKADQGSLISAAAGGNIDTSSGTALDLRMDSRNAAEMDLLTLRNNAAQEALGYTRQADATREQAKFDTKKARNKAFSSLLTSGLDLANKLPAGKP